MDELTLMQDYFWILENCHDPDVKFIDSPVEKKFASIWLSKLCNDIYRGIDAKQMRNQYLLELSACILNGKLSKLFMQTPPRGPLSPFEGASNIKIDNNYIIHEMQAAAAEYIPLNSPRNYQTHMRTKIFDDNRGACAYLAVSLADPKHGTPWMQMGSKKPFLQNNNAKCPQQCRQNACRNNRQATPNMSDAESAPKVNVGFGEFCLDAIAKELAGQASPHACPELEEQLQRYAVFIQKHPIGEEAKGLCGNKLRSFLLVNFQTDLVNALEKCQ